MQAFRLTFSRYLCALIITLTTLCAPSAFGAGFNVDFEALNIGDPPSAIPPVYPGITAAGGTLRNTSIQSGLPYITLFGDVLRANNLTSNIASSYIFFKFAEPVTEFVFEAAMDVAVMGKDIHLECYYMQQLVLDGAYFLSNMTLNSGFYEGTIDFTHIKGLETGCDEIRIGKAAGVPAANLAIDCLRVNNGNGPCPVISEDTDDDGVPDAIDQCPFSKLNFDDIECDPIPNPLDPVTGCTRADDVFEILDNARNRGQYIRQIIRYTRGLRRSREVTRREGFQLLRCAIPAVRTIERGRGRAFVNR